MIHKVFSARSFIEDHQSVAGTRCDQSSSSIRGIIRLCRTHPKVFVWITFKLDWSWLGGRGGAAETWTVFILFAVKSHRCGAPNILVSVQCCPSANHQPYIYMATYYYYYHNDDQPIISRSEVGPLPLVSRCRRRRHGVLQCCWLCSVRKEAVVVAFSTEYVSLSVTVVCDGAEL